MMTVNPRDLEKYLLMNYIMQGEKMMDLAEGQRLNSFHQNLLKIMNY